MNDLLVNTVTQCESMLTPQVFTEASETDVDPNSTSNQPQKAVQAQELVHKTKGKGMGKTTRINLPEPSISVEHPAEAPVTSVPQQERGPKRKEKGKMQRKRVGKSNTKGKSKKKKQIEENQETEENCCSVCSGMTTLLIGYSATTVINGCMENALVLLLRKTGKNTRMKVKKFTIRFVYNTKK